MLQAANTDLFNPLVPKAHISEYQNQLFILKIKPVKSVKLIHRFLFVVSSALIIYKYNHYLVWLDMRQFKDRNVKAVIKEPGTDVRTWERREEKDSFIGWRAKGSFRILRIFKVTSGVLQQPIVVNRLAFSSTSELIYTCMPDCTPSELNLGQLC